MNKSKKTIKGLQNEKKKKQLKINPKVWIIGSAILGLLLIGAILFDQLYKRPIVTIDGDKYYLDDLTYYFYTTESAYNYMNQLYGGSYWDMTYDYSTGMTVRDYAKLEAVNNIVYNEILYREATANGYTLTEEEEHAINEDIEKVLGEDGLPEKLIKKNGFTSEYLKEVMSKLKIASRYKEDVIDTLDIDDEAIKAGIKYDDYRQYDFEYLYISTEKYNDEDSKSESMNDEEKKAAYQKIADMREKALTTEDWSTLIPEDEKELTYRKTNFTASDETSYPDDFKETVMAMENGAISDILETDYGYYVVRMINNNSSESYDQAVEDAIKKAEEEAFSEEYNNNILSKYNYKLNSRAIQNLRMGRITLVD